MLKQWSARTQWVVATIPQSFRFTLRSFASFAVKSGFLDLCMTEQYRHAAVNHAPARH